MDISDVVKRTGIAASALRFYEKKGLIEPISPQGARRRYSPAVLDTLALIALGQAGGFSLDEISGMLGSKGTLQIDRTLLVAKADEVEATIARLQAIAQGLRHAAVCPAENHIECETFRRLLKVATASRQKQSEG